MTRKKIFYGWYIVAASLVLIIMDGLLLYSFGVFLPYLNEEFGFSRAIGSSIFSLRSVILAFSLTIAWRLVDKYDPRAVIISGGIITAIGMLLSGIADKGWELYVSYGFLIGLGDGVLYITCVAVVSRWFIKKRALVIGIITTGIPLSGLIASPLTAWLISSFGLRNAFFALAGLLTLSTLSAIATPVFWLMYSMYFLGFTTFLVVVIHTFSFAVDLGIPALVASGALSAIGIGSILGRVALSGLLTEVLETKKVLILCFFLQGSSLFLLLGVREVWAFYLFGVLFGFFYSGLVPIFPTLLGKFFGLSAMGTIYGFFGTSYCVAAIGGPLLAGYIHDITGSYFYPFLLSIFFCYAGAILSFFIKPPVRIIKPITSVS